MIKSTPPSEIEEDMYYNALDKSLDTYHKHNYLKTKYNSLSDNSKPDDPCLKEIHLN